MHKDGKLQTQIADRLSRDKSTISRELCHEKHILPEEKLREALDPWRMIHPQP